MFIVKAEQQIGQKFAKELSNGHDRFIIGYSLVSKDSLSYTQESYFILIFVPPSRL